ncbi:MAG TPA: FG-GAP-like repeat-containing protein [Planctomycetota bacterium]|nr:FG-GAP-like repeat-containing protein [Planctomycetota bacterium]
MSNAERTAPSRLATLLALGTLLAPRPSPAQGPFQDDPRVPLPDVAASLIARDFNQDGRIDLAAAHPRSGEVSVLLARGAAGDGSFTYLTAVYASGPSTIHLSSGDLDGENGPDIVAAIGGSASVAAFLNQGDGSMGGARHYPVESSPRFVELADLDEDGDLDAVTVNFAAEAIGSVSVLLGDGRGGFEAERGAGAGDNPPALGVADLDADGHIDIVVGHTDALTFLKGRGDGTFEPAVETLLPGGPSAAVAEDLDGDGKADLAMLSLTSGDNDASLLLLRPLAGGRFAVEVLVVHAGRGLRSTEGGSSGFLRSVDIDGDGLRDLLTEVDAGGSLGLRIHRNAGGNVFEAWAAGDLDLREAFTDALFADLNGDGALDVAHGGTESDLGILEGLPGGGFVRQSAVISVPGGARDVLVLDVGGDPRPDLVVRTAGEPYAVLAEDSGFGAPEDVEGVDFAEDMAAGDFDGDGRLDVAFTDLASRSAVIVFFDDAGAAARLARIRMETLPSLVEAADFDGDGQSDLIFTDLGTSDVTVVSDPARPESRKTTSFSVGSGQTALTTGDVDGDGRVDLAVSTEEGARILFGDGAGSFPRSRAPGVLGGARALAIADMDADGEMDLVAATRSGESIVFLPRAAAEADPRVLVIDDGLEVRSISVEDLTGDGRADIALITTRPTSALRVYAGLPGGFEEPRIFRAGTDPRGLALADLDQDGRLDAAVAGFAAKRVTILWGGESTPLAAPFRRGDADLDGRTGLTDAIFTLDALFRGGTPLACEDAADANDDGRVDIADPVALLGYLFRGGPEPPAPGAGSCGPDPTQDDLVSCEAVCP